MNKLSKKLIAALMLALVVNSPVFAEPSQNNSDTLKEKAETIEMNIEKMDNQIESVMRNIDDNKKQIVKTQKDIKYVQIELNNVEKDTKNAKELFNKRIKAMYINGLDSYLNIILDSEGIGDFILRVDNLKKIIGFNKKVIDNYKLKQDSISNKKENLLAENNKLVALKADNERKLSELNKNKEEQKKLLTQAKEQERLYVGNEDQALVNNATRTVNEIRKDVPKLSLSRGATTISDSSVVAYASNFLGTPYVWGGTSLKPGFDCSGFTQYVYRHFGVSIGRTTYDQIKDGVQVSRDQLQPGDLVFFGTWGNPHHMGIYVGNGSYIHAPRTGDVVKVSPLNRKDYLTARRVK
ncbi:TPA: C40 family peptidase [Clostridium botulinum]|uniref:C40 family peptidase n=1 Tax=Clostridium TaxID=1485 RepID=UPI0007730B22|nr:glycoside hydrolase [Clostridium sporogenes]AVQ53406.1 glycoside hydrolase [Clostridium botulinum]HBJ2611723.1 C40 family peptidase [Clostridium botulinum]